VTITTGQTIYRILGKNCGCLQKAQVVIAEHLAYSYRCLRVFATFQKFAGRQILENNLHLLW